ncbi:MlaD family protein [Lysobacter hankyongensis]|uniref:MlaD family protein n=1 Tax=Lysobacter hankyongensis TaxID=1176535 RepID=A0ABP9BPV6_9GAMM
METRANYVMIGVFTLAAAAFMLLFGLWAAKYTSDKDWRYYDVIFDEAVTGLTEGGSVQYNGIGVGTVAQLSLAPDDPRKVIARVKLRAATPVKVDTHAKLSFTGLTGTAFIQLTGGSPKAALLTAPGDAVPVIQTEASALQNIAETANKLVARLDKVLSEDNIHNITQTLDNIESATGALADQREDLGALIRNARVSSEKLSATLDTTNTAIADVDRELVQKLPQLIAKLDSTLNRLDSAAGNANALLSENRGAINSFTQDGLSQLGPTLDELRALVRDLRKISSRLEDNPAGYVLGRQKPKEFEPK